MQLTNENYYSQEANKAYFSVSQVKAFMKCPACAMAELNGQHTPPKTTSLLVGGFVDSYFSGEIEEFQEANPEVYTKNGNLRSEYRHAQKIIDRIEKDPLCMDITFAPAQQIFTGEIDGYPFKVKLDFLLGAQQAQLLAKKYSGMSELLFEDGAIVDMKIMKDFAPHYREGEGRLNWIEYWQYDLQLAIYQEIVRQNTGKLLPCYILGATKEETPDLCLFKLPQEVMNVALDIFRPKLPGIADVKSGKVKPEMCGTCSFCRENKVLNGATWFEEV